MRCCQSGGGGGDGGGGGGETKKMGREGVGAGRWVEGTGVEKM